MLSRSCHYETAKQFFERSVEVEVNFAGRQLASLKEDKYAQHDIASAIHCLHLALQEDPKDQESSKLLRHCLRLVGSKENFLEYIQFLHDEFYVELLEACRSSDSILGKFMSAPERSYIFFSDKRTDNEREENKQGVIDKMVELRPYKGKNLQQISDHIKGLPFTKQYRETRNSQDEQTSLGQRISILKSQHILDVFSRVGEEARLHLTICQLTEWTLLSGPALAESGLHMDIVCYVTQLSLELDAETFSQRCRPRINLYLEERKKSESKNTEHRASESHRKK